jgi:hypothetical protein
VGTQFPDAPASKKCQPNVKLNSKGNPMKTLLACLIFSVLVSVFAYVCMSDEAKNASWVVYLNPVGVVLGFVTALHGILQSKKNLGLLGLTQLSFWPLYGFILRIFGTTPPIILQILLTTLTTLYLGASLVFFVMAFYNERFNSKPHETAAP